MKSNDIKKANVILAQLNIHIETFLKKLAEEEYKLVDTPRIKKIVLREWRSCGMIFCIYETTNQWNRREDNTTLKIDTKTTNYKIKQVNDNDVVVTIKDGTEITIPLEYNENQFNDYCKKFFKPLLKEMNDIEEHHKTTDREIEKRKKQEKRTLSVHTDGKYTYQWKECGHCRGRGKISCGTGRYRQASYIDGPNGGDIDGEVEIYEDVRCPECHGSGGFIEYQTEGKYGPNKKPCSKWRFEQNQDDFVAILTS